MSMANALNDCVNKTITLGTKSGMSFSKFESILLDRPLIRGYSIIALEFFNIIMFLGAFYTGKLIQLREDMVCVMQDCTVDYRNGSSKRDGTVTMRMSEIVSILSSTDKQTESLASSHAVAPLGDTGGTSGDGNTAVLMTGSLESGHASAPPEDTGGTSKSTTTVPIEPNEQSPPGLQFRISSFIKKCYGHMTAFIEKYHKHMAGAFVLTFVLIVCYLLRNLHTHEVRVRGLNLYLN